MLGNRGIRYKGWKAVTFHGDYRGRIIPDGPLMNINGSFTSSSGITTKETVKKLLQSLDALPIQLPESGICIPWTFSAACMI
jgi:hypothetical protein